VKNTVAVLECLVSFVAATCVPVSKRDAPSAQSSAYNSLSFKRSNNNTPSKKSNTTPLSISTPKEDKVFFVTCGAFEMAVCLLRMVLEEHTTKVSSSSWSRHKREALDTFDSIGVADSIANVQIESTMPQNAIPALVMKIMACLTHNASDSLKTDRILPHLTNIVHQSMMIFLPSPEIQRYGCWTLMSLSNPLLQELIAAGSFSILVNAMKCHPYDVGVQEHGNNALYNLLPLLIVCYNNNNNSSSSSNSSNTDKNKIQNAADPDDILSMDTATPAAAIEIDGKQLEDYSSLLPSLPSIVLRGMEEHPDHLAVQQYGLLVLTRLCQQDQETYEIVVSEGGLTALLNVVFMATTHTYSALATDDYHYSSNNNNNNNSSQNSISEKHDCLAQMACQFLRDLSRPSNSSMDILRIIAVKGGTQTVLRVLDHYNREHVGGGYANGNGHGHHHHHHHHHHHVAHYNRFAVNIIDPAMACLRNLMTNEDNRSEIMTLSKMSMASQQQASTSTTTGAAQNDNDADADGDGDDQTSDINISKSNSGESDQTDSSTNKCVNILPIVLATMDLYPLDAAIQAYGCDLLGRLAQGEEMARMELIESTIFVHNDGDGNDNDNDDNINGNGNNDSNYDSKPSNNSRLWKKTPQSTNTNAEAEVAGEGSLESSPSAEDAEMIDLTEQLGSSSIMSSTSENGRADSDRHSGSSSKVNKIDSLVTVVRAMRNHRTHSGVQERSVVLLLAMVLDRSATVASSASSSRGSSSSASASSYLIQRLQEVYDGQRDPQDPNDPSSLLSFLQSAIVTPRGTERLKKLIQVMEEYTRKTKRASIYSPFGTTTTNNNSNQRHAANNGGHGSSNGLVGTFLARRWNQLAVGRGSGNSSSG